jgi:hypothetical protein
MFGIESEGRPILVTGAHRSGTTWVGKTLAQAPGVGYIHEPFKITRRPGVCNVPIAYWYTYVNDDNSLRYYEPVKQMLEFRYNFSAEMASLRSPRDVLRMVRDSSRMVFTRYLFRQRTLVKDPFLLFSSEWLEEKFNTQVVILVRHPAAFISSILKKGWYFPFNHWVNQDALMRDHLSPFASDIRKFADNPPPLIDQAILLWNCIYHAVYKLHANHASWLVIRHEDISLKPMVGFKQLYDSCGLKWTSRVGKYINQTTNSRNPIDPVNNDSFNVTRNSKANIKSWQKRLREDEVRHIYSETKEVSRYFYSDIDWE